MGFLEPEVPEPKIFLCLLLTLFFSHPFPLLILDLSSQVVLVTKLSHKQDIKNV